jgi:pimeloyl-ACP methyl ester carboxylesterase
MNRTRLILYLSLLGLLVVLVMVSTLFTRTGFMRSYQLDDTDAVRWQRDERGVIVGNDAFTITGTTDHCWLLLHSYAASPDEMRALAEAIYATRQDTVVVPRLQGHATLPSELQQYTMDDWYTQVERELLVLKTTCAQVHIVGSSIGGALALRLAEDHDVAGV